jgi:asparagine synthase (glutamine-hydrolysing)
MCGIVGTFRFDGQPIDIQLLRQQVTCLRHRGPDGSGTWSSRVVGLGHTRLAIIDLSVGGAQPMSTTDGSYTLIYNGELYNAPELKTALRSPWHFRGHSDTEVLLYSFADYGAACFPRLEGIFAFAVYEAATQRLWLARDPFGVKPLYYHLNRNRLLFASEIRSLLLDPETPRQPNHAALRQHVLFGYAVDPETAFHQILRLPPAHAMRIDVDGAVSIAPYWQVEDLGVRDPADLLSTLADSVRRQSVADVPTGLFLSGGLDSSLILAQMAHVGVLSPTFKAYNVGLDPDDPVLSYAGRTERAAALRSSQRYGVELCRIHPSSGGAVMLADILMSVEEPICNPSNSLIDLICQRAKENSTTVLLSGHGGDEIFAGYRRHVWARYLGLLRQWGNGGLAWLMVHGSQGTLVRRMAASLRPAETLHPLISIAAVGWDLVTDRVVEPDWFASTAIPAVAAPLETMLARWRGHSFLKQMMLLDLHTYLSAQNLINMDKASMRRSVEVRVPFLDRSLVAIGLHASDRALVVGLQNKVLIRHAARELLPPELFKTPKLGFGPPQVTLVQGDEARELLFGARTKDRGLFHQERLRSRMALLRHGSENLALQLYGLAVIEQWFRLFMDQAPTKTAA